MQRTSVVAEIFGYLVCFVAVLVFFVSVAGVVSGAFRIANPTTAPREMMQHIVAVHPPNALPPPPGLGSSIVRDRFTAVARYDAIRRFVVAVVMLVLSIVVFNRAFGWLNPSNRTAGNDDTRRRHER
jgi:hypothetical protein